MAGASASWSVLHGDCLQVMATLEESSVDSIVTDPPYGLKFMGRDWDHGVPGVPFWQAALRVAKPGAFLLAFGGTRTWHRLACAIEDAGWEIRDTISFLHDGVPLTSPLLWITGQGFPKSKNFGCKCQTNVVTYHDGKKSQSQVCVPDLRQGVPPSSLLGQKDGGTVLQSPMRRSSPGAGVGDTCAQEPSRVDCGESGGFSTKDDGGPEPRLEGRGNVLPEARQLQTNQVRAVPVSVPGDGAEGRVCDGTPAADGAKRGPVSIADGSGTPQKPRPTRQSPRKPRPLSLESGTQEGRVGICPKCGGLIDFAGYGSALKPAFEPILVAMKPLDGTFAGNAERHGVAGLNVDGCRIPGNWTTWRRADGSIAEGGNMPFSDNAHARREQSSLGRWPANVVLDEEAAAMLDEQSGQRTTSKPGTVFRKTPHDTVAMAGRLAINGEQVAYGDFGGASRFFYCAKASRAEREAGLQGPALPAGGMAGRRDGSLGGAPVVRRNHHPTVKPLALMEWLCKLTATPTGGLVLDPFCGSGTTGVACLNTGRRFIGIEQDHAYCEIARARIAHAEAQRKAGAPLLSAAGK